MAEAHENPFLWLLTQEQLVKQHARGLPRREKVQKIWRGIAFRVSGALLVCALDEIREVIACPAQMARVPGTKNWVKGIANNRGLLLPVIDLHLCIGGKTPTIPGKRCRLLIINQAGVSSGVLVDEVLGIKHFLEESRNPEQNKDVWYSPFARGAFEEDGEVWTVFDVQALSNSRTFLDAAL